MTPRPPYCHNPPGYEDDPDEDLQDEVEDDRDAEDLDIGDDTPRHNYGNY